MRFFLEIILQSTTRRAWSATRSRTPPGGPGGRGHRRGHRCRLGSRRQQPRCGGHRSEGRARARPQGAAGPRGPSQHDDLPQRRRLLQGNRQGHPVSRLSAHLTGPWYPAGRRRGGSPPRAPSPEPRVGGVGLDGLRMRGHGPGRVPRCGPRPTRRSAATAPGPGHTALGQRQHGQEAELHRGEDQLRRPPRPPPPEVHLQRALSVIRRTRDVENGDGAGCGNCDLDPVGMHSHDRRRL